MLSELEKIIQDRRRNPVEGSYTNKLQDSGLERIMQKIGEEAVELIIAAGSQSKKRTIEETADLFYHMLVLLDAKDISLEDVENELRDRHSSDTQPKA